MSTDTRLGPYRIIRLINEGGQGSVYLGYDRRLQRRVAIKVYTLPGQRAVRKQCLREAQLVAAIHSPKVVQVYDVIDSPEHLALVMEYVPGCDLEEFLSAVRPSLGSILAICGDVAGALAVTRQQRIVHGDLKASNILISDTGRVKLTDFGIARFAGEGADTAGSRTALSPEQCLGRPMDIRSDLFVLGCLLYRMLTGVQPFCRGGRLDTRMLLEQQPMPLGELISPEMLPPDELVALVDQLLQKDPADRPANTHAVRRVLRKVSREIPLAASHSLLAEARPCFRRELSADMPPHIPRDLLREGRSRLGAAAEHRPGAALRRWLVESPARSVLAAVAALAAAGSLVLVLRGGATPVYVEQPVLQVHGDVNLPDEVSGRWLVEQALAAVSESMGPLQSSGPGAPAGGTLYAPGAAPDRGQPDERLHIGLRCTAALCVYEVSRERGGVAEHQQAILFPDRSIVRWRQLIRSATAALYR